VLIYLRHSDDRGEDVYRHDRPLNDRGRKKARKSFTELAERYGHPDTLFVSPFRRALQTLEAMASQFKRPVDIHRDSRIAQHLSGKQRRDPRVSPETLEAISVHEDESAFRMRVQDHVEDVRRRVRAGAVIWGITHQVVIEEVAGHFGVEISEDLDFLDHIVMLR
jgi:broad specificity phosphatase PhoE